MAGRLDDGKGREGTAAFHLVFEGGREIIHLFGHFLLVDDTGGPLQQTAVQVEDISGVCLTSGWTAQDKGYFTVCHGLLGEVVVDHQGVTPRVPEILSDGGAGKGSVVLRHRVPAGF